IAHDLRPSRIATGNACLPITPNRTANLLSPMRQKTGSAILCNVRGNLSGIAEAAAGRSGFNRPLIHPRFRHSIRPTYFLSDLAAGFSDAFSTGLSAGFSAEASGGGLAPLKYCRLASCFRLLR